MPYYRYTLIFLTRQNNGEEILMLHRHNPPNQGLWNGVGGHLEPGETPLAGALREVQEETGYCLTTARFAGVLTWQGHTETPGGLYIFVASVPVDSNTPLHTTQEYEGELAWQPRDWVLSSPEVVSNIHKIGADVLDGTPPQEYHFVYDPEDRIIDWEIRPLPLLE
jgi:8-oxo-dGTP diphosphatase